MSYYRDTYLKSEHWQNLRLQKLVDSSCTCAICLKISKSNDVHHVSYSTSLWDVQPKDLRVLCRSCHERVHHVVDSYLKDSAKTKEEKWRWAYALISEEVAFQNDQDETKRQADAQKQSDAEWSPMIAHTIKTNTKWAWGLLVLFLSAKFHEECSSRVSLIKMRRKVKDATIQKLLDSGFTQENSATLRKMMSEKKWYESHPEILEIPDNIEFTHDCRPWTSIARRDCRTRVMMRAAGIIPPQEVRT